MNFEEESSDLSSAQEQQIENELNNKLLSNYRKIKDSLRKQQLSSNSKYSINELENAIQAEQHKNLKTRITLVERQYAKARENNILLLKKLGQAEEYTQQLTAELEHLRRENQSQMRQNKVTIENLRHEIQYLREDHTKTVDNKEINALQQLLSLREQEIAKLNLKIKSLELSLSEKESYLKADQVEIQELTSRLQMLEFKPQQLQLASNSRGQDLFELDQAREATKRLLSLLKNTEEYKQFHSYTQVCGEMAFLHDFVEAQRQPGEGHKRHSCYHEVKIDERLVWTPNKCYKALLKIKSKHENLTESCIQEILFQLNKLWLSREETHISKVKEQYEQELVRLRSKHSYKYDQLVARKQIERLKKELQQTRLSKMSPSEQLTHLRSTGEYEDQLRMKSREIKLLTERLQLVEQEKVNYDKVLYLQGALWLIDKVLDQVQLYQEQLRQHQTRLAQRTDLIQQNQPEKLLGQFSETFQQSASALHEKLLLMKETTLKKIGLQNNDLVDPEM